MTSSRSEAFVALTTYLLVPRPHQREATTAILSARASGRPGFLLGDMTGLGKTLAVWCAVAVMPERDVLVVCPTGAIPQWRRTIALAGLSEKAVTLINYERTKSLMSPPAASKRRSTRAKNNELAKHGRRRRHGRWSCDESHRLRNLYAQQSLVCRQLADAAGFSIFMSATAGQQHMEDVRRERVEQVILKPKPLQREIEARHARRLIDRLAAGRANGDADAAARARDHLERYAAEGCTPLIPEMCLSEMRRDGLMHGETPSANESGQLGSRRAELLQ